MKPRRSTNSEIQARLISVEMISQVLASTSPHDLGRRLTTHLRELTGARTILLLAHPVNGGSHELLHVCPEGQAGFFSVHELESCCSECAPNPMPHRTKEMPPDHPMREMLSRAQVSEFRCFPLRAGGEAVGNILLLNPPFMDIPVQLADTINLLCPSIALALKHALAFRRLELQRQQIEIHASEMERRVEERTAELSDANQQLNDSRMAALNMMEDAIAARDTAQQANAELCLEIERRQQAEKEVRRLNLTLEQKVEERTAQLEAANKELEAFSYSVSHDLRAPLRALDGFAGILNQEHAHRLDKEGHRLLGVLQSEARRMGQLIDDLLNFSRVGRVPMKLEEVDMTALAREVLEEQIRLCPGRSPALNLASLPPALGDRTLIRMVWTNLISNALKFTQYQSNAVIEIGAITETSGNVNYYIRDNGAGFNMTYAHKLFRVFQRLHSSATFEGTGVGLALAQRIVHRHGGRTRAEGAVDAGATFYFSLSQESHAP